MPIKRNKNLTLLNIPGTFVMNDDDVRLFRKEWLCPNMHEAKAVIFIIPDVGEHSDYYEEFAKRLNEYNFHVCTMDYIGHGRSEGPRFVVKDFDSVIRDIDTNILYLRAKFNATPIILFGYSFGAILAMIAVHRNELIYRGIILENPFHEFSTLPKDPINSCLCGIAGNYVMNLDLLMDNKDFIEYIKTEKNSYKGYIKTVTVKAAQEISHECFDNVSQIKVPLLIFHGDENKISNKDVSQKIFDEWASDNKGLTVVQNGKHMIHNEEGEASELLISSISVWVNGICNKSLEKSQSSTSAK